MPRWSTSSRAWRRTSKISRRRGFSWAPAVRRGVPTSPAWRWSDRRGDQLEELALADTVRPNALRKLAGARLQEAALAWQLAKDADGSLAAIEAAIRHHEHALDLSPGMPQLEQGLVWSQDLCLEVLLDSGEVEAAAEAALEVGRAGPRSVVARERGAEARPLRGAPDGSGGWPGR